MKLELYNKRDLHGMKIKEFLIKNNLPFSESCSSESRLKITRSHSICIIEGFNDILLNQLLEGIKKYKPKMVF